MRLRLFPLTLCERETFDSREVDVLRLSRSLSTLCLQELPLELLLRLILEEELGDREYEL